MRARKLHRRRGFSVQFNESDDETVANDALNASRTGPIALFYRQTLANVTLAQQEFWLWDSAVYFYLFLNYDAGNIAFLLLLLLL